ncbi:hypothetical protein [Mucilaginibacter arboris]|uniref:Uncharacterized protein n=1 Tax=Mucilaginibacter arboris TaxID=2682090 RepID=A0A7K1SZD4_9SPHI|nr:hypothetical protein [Mucilaginibacter arboris]MVN22684.1 hypothetical protein [Mucilaginibacter arboris]
MKPKTMFYISLIAGICILGEALYTAVYSTSARNSFSISWNLMAGGYLLFAAFRNYKLMKAEENAD